jgi:hypothetical protein
MAKTNRHSIPGEVGTAIADRKKFIFFYLVDL